jgi:hypothetical protein
MGGNIECVVDTTDRLEYGFQRSDVTSGSLRNRLYLISEVSQEVNKVQKRREAMQSEDGRLRRRVADEVKGESHIPYNSVRALTLMLSSYFRDAVSPSGHG